VVKDLLADSCFQLRCDSAKNFKCHTPNTASQRIPLNHAAHATMANPLFLNHPFPEDWQQAPAPMDLPTKDSGSQMGSLTSSKRKKVAGKVALLSRESEQGDVEMRSLLSLESEDETGKSALYSMQPENNL